MVLANKDYSNTHCRIQNLTNNSEIGNSPNKSHMKISKFTVLFSTRKVGKSGKNKPFYISSHTCMYKFFYFLTGGEDRMGE